MILIQLWILSLVLTLFNRLVDQVEGKTTNDTFQVPEYNLLK